MTANTKAKRDWSARLSLVRVGDAISLRSLCVWILAACSTTDVASQTQPPPVAEYGIKEAEPRTGSRIRKAVVGPTSIPVNLSYDQLSPETQARFKQNYEEMAEGDEPPFPRGGLKEVLEPIHKAQSKLLVRGDLFLTAKVDASGVAQSVTAIGSPSPEMTKVASHVLMLTKFKPAMCSGQPCSMEFPLRMRFKVN